MCLTREDLFEATDRVVALAAEFEGAPMAEKLRAFGLDMSDVAELLHERWEAYEEDTRGAHPKRVWTQGFTEGLLVCAMLMRGAATE